VKQLSQSRFPLTLAVLLMVCGAAASPVSGRPQRAYLLGREIDGRGLYYVAFITGDDRRGGHWLVNLETGEQSRRQVPEGQPPPRDGEVYELDWASLTLLPCAKTFDLGLNLTADSVGVDTLRSSAHRSVIQTRYSCWLAVTLDGQTATVPLTVYSDTSVKAWGVFEIPGHHERVVLISYLAGPYQAEGNLPVVIAGDQ